MRVDGAGAKEAGVGGAATKGKAFVGRLRGMGVYEVAGRKAGGGGEAARGEAFTGKLEPVVRGGGEGRGGGGVEGVLAGEAGRSRSLFNTKADQTY